MLNNVDRVRALMDEFDWQDIEPNGNVSQIIVFRDQIRFLLPELGLYDFGYFCLQVQNCGGGLVSLTCY